MSDKLFSGGTPLGIAGQLGAKLLDAGLVDKLAAYKRRVAGNYRPLAPGDIDALAPGKMWISPKLDGELWFLASWKSEVFFANAKGSVIHGALPFLPEPLKALPEGTLIAGELYARVNERRSRVGDLAAAMAKGKSAKVDAVYFAAFDLVQEAGSPSSAVYSDRHDRLKALLPEKGNVEVIPVEEVSTASDIRKRFESKVESGELEGLILRTQTGLIHKIKPAISIDAVILGYTAKGDQPDRARSVLLGLTKEDGTVQVLGACGNLGGDDARAALFGRMSKIAAVSSVRYASDSGGLYSFVKPEIVVEVEVTDFQAEQSNGEVSLAMVVQFGADGWNRIGMSPCPRPIHPVLVRVREDKRADSVDTRLSQVAGYAATQINGGDGGPSPKSELIRREVWIKESKGKTAVRKLLVWKTNKEAQSKGRFPAYVVHWTDYSPSRAEPLDREVKLAPNENDARKIADDLVKENIKKGWDKVS
jgi:hypothetical protein